MERPTKWIAIRRACQSRSLAARSHSKWDFNYVHTTSCLIIPFFLFDIRAAPVGERSSLRAFLSRLRIPISRITSITSRAIAPFLLLYEENERIKSRWGWEKINANERRTEEETGRRKSRERKEISVAGGRAGWRGAAEIRRTKNDEGKTDGRSKSRLLCKEDVAFFLRVRAHSLYFSFKNS